MKTKSYKNLGVIGFAIFAMFFGAGNLIFPSFIGKMAGDKFLQAIIGFLITGVGLPLTGIIACAKVDGTFIDICRRVGNNFAIILTTILILCIGPLLAIPRTAATTYELGIHIIFPSVTPIMASIIYFSICLLLVLRSSKIIDVIGKFLTPILIIMLSIIIIKGIMFPIGTVQSNDSTQMFTKSLLEGYQTMDVMASVIFSSIIISSIKSKGYKTKKDVINITIKASIIAILGLSFVYSGLMYLGSQTVNLVPNNISRSALLVEIVHRDLGSIGPIILGITVGFACITTAIGLISTGAEYFSKITNNKISYNTCACIIVFISMLLSTGGVENIVKYSSPILTILYPIVIILIFSTLAERFIQDDRIVKFTVYTVLIVNCIDAFNTITNKSIYLLNIIFSNIPFNSYGFSWIIPCFIALILSYFIFNTSILKTFTMNEDKDAC